MGGPRLADRELQGCFRCSVGIPESKARSARQREPASASPQSAWAHDGWNFQGPPPARLSLCPPPLRKPRRTLKTGTISTVWDLAAPQWSLGRPLKLEKVQRVPKSIWVALYSYKYSSVASFLSMSPPPRPLQPPSASLSHPSPATSNTPLLGLPRLALPSGWSRGPWSLEKTGSPG